MVTGRVFRESAVQSEERVVLWKLYGKRYAQAALAVLWSLESLYEGVVRGWEETAVYCGMSFLSIVSEKETRIVCFYSIQYLCRASVIRSSL